MGLTWEALARDPTTREASQMKKSLAQLPPIHQLDDLVHSATRGELSNFSTLYAQYAALVRSIVFKLCGEHELDDLVQETFVSICRGLIHFRNDCTLKTWICRVTYNAAVSRLRQRKRHLQTTELSDNEPAPESVRPEAQSIVHVALLELTVEHRTVIVLHHLEGFSVTEVAEILDIPEGTVKSRLFHAKENLHGILKSKGVSL